MEEFIDGVQKAEDNALKGGRYFADVALEGTKSKANELTTKTEGVKAGETTEGTITKQIENVTSKVPSATFLSLAIGSVALSAMLRMFGRKDDAQFVGHWVPTILTLGLYNKLVKLEGSE